MKVLIYLTGLVTSMMMAGGWAMATLHIPGIGDFSSYELSVYGYMAFAILYLPAVTLSRFRTQSDMVWFERTRLSMGLLCSLVTFGAMLLKILHAPGANMLLVIGVGIFTFGFLPALFFSLYKESKIQF